MTAILTTDELAARLDDPCLKVIDASWHMPSEQRDAEKEYAQAHIPGALFFNIDTVCDRASPYPHMLPAAGQFAEAIGHLGISSTDTVTVYDSSGIFSSPRLWWMLRVFGHCNVAVLDGGLPKWSAEGRTLHSGEMRNPAAVFSAQLQPRLLRNMHEIEDNIDTKRELVVDARSPGRFNGEQPEPRPGLPSGHIPGSLNIFFKDCLAQDNTFKSTADLEALFAARGVDASLPIVASCGSGVTACILALALYELGNENVAVYDGAWAEWGGRKA